MYIEKQDSFSSVLLILKLGKIRNVFATIPVGGIKIAHI